MLRTGFTVHAFLCAAMTEKSEKTTNEIIFSGKKVEDWFRFDRQVLRAVRKKFGTVGEKLWSETAIAIDENSVAAIANDSYAEILRKEGFKEAAQYWDWEYFWSVAYQKSYRERMYVGIRDYVEERTSGRAFQHMVEVQVEDLPTLRSALQRKFAKATPALIRRMVV